MSLISTILIFIASICITQIFGYKKFFYIRFYNFIIINLSLFICLNYYFNFSNFLINLLLLSVLIFSWAGFVTHISNSIFFTLLKIVNDKKVKNFDKLLKIYNVKKKYHQRLKLLNIGNYIRKKNFYYVFNYSIRNIIIIKILIFLRNI
jgi:hypothetical protein